MTKVGDRNPKVIVTKTSVFSITKTGYASEGFIYTALTYKHKALLRSKVETKTKTWEGNHKKETG